MTKVIKDEHFECVDCRGDTREEYYMVHDTIWAEADMEPFGGMLCIGCLELRLGYRLHAKDFPKLPINDINGASPRMRARLVE